MQIGKAVRVFALLGCLSSLAAGVAAQKIAVKPGDVLVPGETAEIQYTNPSLAGQTVTIQVSGGFPTPAVETVTITLDADGVGSGKWLVRSDWRSARFNGPDAQEVGVPIDVPPQGQ